MTLTSVYRCAAGLQRVLLTVVSLKYTWFALASKSGHLTTVNLRNGVGRLVCKFDAPFKRRTGVCFFLSVDTFLRKGVVSLP